MRDRFPGCQEHLGYGASPPACAARSAAGAVLRGDNAVFPLAQKAQGVGREERAAELAPARVVGRRVGPAALALGLPAGALEVLGVVAGWCKWQGVVLGGSGI
jgi:hypothetical protein